MNSKLMLTATSLSACFYIASLGNTNKAIAYDPVVTCEANFRQAPYNMQCWSDKLGKETTIRDFVKAIESGEITR
jgi:hypothetical protein